MSLRQIAFLCGLTVVYLTFELAFNARLLDVVGGVASTADVHHIENFGRSLSGIAAALVLFQVLMARRHRSITGSPGTMGIVFWCALVAVLVYIALYGLVEQLAARSTPEFRRLALNIELIQRALVEGRVEIDGLTDDRSLFSQPQGKAFLALFPALAVSVDRLDDKIRDAKLQLIERSLDRVFEGPKGYYNSYSKAITETRTRWAKYRGRPQDMSARIAREQDNAWRDYLSDLGKRGWTPSSVPRNARSAVLRKVRGRIPVSQNWQLGDEVAFREAVAARARKQAGVLASGAGSVTVHGRRVAAGLSFEDFVRQVGVQMELRDRMKAPTNLEVAAAYGSADSFDRQLYRPMLRHSAQKALQEYDAPAADFGDSGALRNRGIDAVRAVIVPPIALFFSLLGAIGHMAKLAFLLVKGAHVLVARRWSESLFARLTRNAWWVPVAGFAIAWACLSALENSVTQSRLYAYMRAQTLGKSGDVQQRLVASVVVNAMHVVAVGQGHAYPYNERIRNGLLGGISFGYQDTAR